MPSETFRRHFFYPKEKHEIHESIYGKQFKRPQKMSEIRQKHIKEICHNNGQQLISITRNAEAMLVEIENKTGVSAFDWANYTKRMNNLTRKN